VNGLGLRGKKVLVTGASGLLGLNLGFQAAGRYRVTGVVNSNSLTHAPFEVVSADLGIPGTFARILERARPDFVIHAAALANIDDCEKNPNLSGRLNAELPGEVAETCAQHGLGLLHISTEAVFDGMQGGYVEDDAPNPQGVYARDKLAGELAVAAGYPQAAIARVNFYGWSLLGKRSLAEFFFNNLQAGQRVNGFTDVLFCPLLANDLSDLLLEMLEKGLRGTYHVLSRESLSKYQFGVQIAQRFALDASLISPISVLDGGLAAKRSPNLSASVAKLEAALGHPTPAQAEGIEKFYQLFRQGYPQRVQALAARA
jgi:dTDP-4-dehydrorhamnose reductase